MALAYYLSSIPTLLRGVQNPIGTALGLLLNRRPVTLALRDGTRFHIRSAMDAWIVKETCLDKDYEHIAITIEDGWTVVDIGAGMGDFAVSVAYTHPHCRVYAYEPFPESFALLQENVALNRVTNVVPVQRGVSGVGGSLVLALTGAAVQHSTSVEPIKQTHNSTNIPIESVSLEQLLADIVVCDFLKIDCEGAEFDILLNASPLALSKIRCLALEYHDGVTPHSHHDLAAFLQSHGFDVISRANPVHPSLGLMSARRIPPGEPQS